MIKGKKIFITGGAGYLGQNLIKRYHDSNEITIFSRDESKHYFLNKKYPKVKCIIGDIRNETLLLSSSKGHDLAIFAASMKQIDAVTNNIEEANEIIIKGALNAKKAAVKNSIKSVFISSDKSRAPTTIYGAMKYVAGESFITGESSSNCSTVLYGNVVNSTGSVIPLIWDAIKNNYSISLFDEEMTRFSIEIDTAMDAIEYAFQCPGHNVIPKISSIKIKDLFEIYSSEFKLKYNIGVPRPNEKTHEVMISKEEVPRVIDGGHYYLMHPTNIFKSVKFKNDEYSSADVTIGPEELYNFLKLNNFYTNV